MLLIMVFLCVPRSMMWNDEEDQKSHLFGDFFDPNIAIDFEG